MHKELEILEQEFAEAFDFDEQIILAERIHNLKMKINGVDRHNDSGGGGCMSCGS